MILGYPVSAKKLWVKSELVWLGFTMEVASTKCGISEAELRFTLEKRNYCLNWKTLL